LWFYYVFRQQVVAFLAIFLFYNIDVLRHLL